MNDADVGSNLATAWRHQRVWSLTANALNRRIAVWRTVFLIMTLTGAALVTLGVQLTGTWPGTATISSALGAVVLALAPVIHRNRLGKNSVAEWSRARSASEGLKREVFLYQTKADPYGDKNRDTVLNERYRKLLAKVNDLILYATAVEPDAKPLPPRMDPRKYIEQRVDAQIDNYYRPKAALIARRLVQFRRLEFALAFVAAGFAAVATLATVESVATSVGAWVAVVTTASAAVAAHVAATRYEYLATTYGATANRLESLRDSWTDQGPDAPMSPSDFVHNCEDAISVENQAWMAEWAESPGTPTSDGD